MAALLLSPLSGCGKRQEASGSLPESLPQESAGETETAALPDTQESSQADETADYDESSAVTVELTGDSAAASSDSVQISGSVVQLTQGGTYLISGTLEDGMLVVNAPDTESVQLVFDGVSIASSDCAALYVLEADEVTLTLAEGSENSLANGGSFTPIDDENIDAALYSKQDLVLNGSGSLTVTSPAGHGIVAKDDLVITGGALQVTAASHGLDANDSICFTGASLTVTAGKDGLHCENNDDTALGYVSITGGSLTIDAQGDGISAGATLQVTAGTLDILAGGGSENGEAESSENWGGFMGGGPGGGPGGWPGSQESTWQEEDSTSMKGLKSEALMQLDGGTFLIDSADDALHSNASLTVNGGDYTIASGDDALHAEETLTVNAGTIRISTCYEGLEALHVAVAGGDIRLVAGDDGLNAAGGTDSSGMNGGRDGMFGGGGFGGGMGGSSDGSIVISGGTLYINASGDGIDANGTLEITGGVTTVVGPTYGDTATLDYDVSATITGGIFIGTGASGMAQTFSASQQGVIALSVGGQSAEAQITVTDSDGATLLSYAPELSYQVLIFSSPELVSGETYTITIGAQSGEVEAY